MPWIARFLFPRPRKSQQELAGRAAEVIAHVLFDIGVDRFLDGTMLVDRRLKVRFVSAAILDMPVHAAVHAGSLAQARALCGCLIEGPLGGPALRQQVAPVAEELMAAFLAQSPELRELPVGAQGAAVGCAP